MASVLGRLEKELADRYALGAGAAAAIPLRPTRPSRHRWLAVAGAVVGAVVIGRLASGRPSQAMAVLESEASQRGIAPLGIESILLYDRLRPNPRLVKLLAMMRLPPD
ncbi:MAG: hypothetical protein EXR94_08235 [Gemmatimonadetes bacterium]|nr:hypothetical protein [Gemmatimonadota bacterium]